ncbi:MAG TPA: RNA polymerase sigma factor [Solirubrobacterales bacterium]|jgi:RNA polymerase sigma-70 factor (ECF subfamily)|nr:RNA polymerase sigma factor [Solirubrobacterales bacterium]
MRDRDFERLYEDHAQALFGFLAYRTGDRTLAEEVMSESFERALRARKRYDPGRASAKTWLYSIALNCLRDHQRRQGAEVRALDRVGGPAGIDLDDPNLGRADTRDEVQRALAALSDEEREVVALRYGGELTAKEAAKLLGEKETTVEGRLYRALRKLRGELGPL